MIAVIYNHVTIGLLVSYDNKENREVLDPRIIAHLEESLIVAEFGDKEPSFFVLVIRNISKAEELMHWIEEQKGVEKVRLDILQDLIELYDSYYSLVDRLASN